MALKEFELIETFFKRKATNPNTLLSSGDDAALFLAPESQAVVTCVDTLVEDVHFFKNAPAHAVGYKALAVNLSDLAAMGATPCAALLALTLPESNETWLTEFSRGFFELADQWNIDLIGGDTSRGPLTISVTAYGFVPPQQVLRRRGAKAGDDIYVTGTIGGACFELAHYKNNKIALLNCDHLHYPTPRLPIGKAVRTMATACIDISDGLAQDVSHILDASHVGAELNLSSLPLPEKLTTLPKQHAWKMALTGGDDYELCFTCPPEKKADVAKLAHKTATPITRIGRITSSTELILLNEKKEKVDIALSGFVHFQ